MKKASNRCQHQEDVKDVRISWQRFLKQLTLKCFNKQQACLEKSERKKSQKSNRKYKQGGDFRTEKYNNQKKKQKQKQNSIDGFCSRVERADERISKLENKTTGLPWWSSGWKSTCIEGDMDPWSGKIPHAIKRLSLWTTTTDAQAPRACAPKQEKRSQWEARTPQPRAAPCTTKGSPCAAPKAPCGQK